MLAADAGVKAGVLIDPVDITSATRNTTGYPSAVKQLMGMGKKVALIGRADLGFMGS